MYLRNVVLSGLTFVWVACKLWVRSTLRWIFRDFTRQHCRITPFEVRVSRDYL